MPPTSLLSDGGGTAAVLPPASLSSATVPPEAVQAVDQQDKPTNESAAASRAAATTAATAPLAEPPLAATAPTLASWLAQPDSKFALALAPGFFGFYAHIGALKALDEAGLLGDRVSFASGASAGALVAGLYAAGLTPADMAQRVVTYQRSDFWDPVGVGSVLRGRAFEGLIRSSLPPGVTQFEQCHVPLGVTGFSLSSLATQSITSGDMALAMRASCTFPVLFQPVWHPQGVLMDGGVLDTAGMWAVPDEGEHCRRILNITFGTAPEPEQVVPPSAFPSRLRPRKTPHPKEVVSLVLTDLPRPHPFAMHKGQLAIDAAYALVKHVLSRPMVAGQEPGHWLVPTPPAVAAKAFSAAAGGGAASPFSKRLAGGVCGAVVAALLAWLTVASGRLVQL